MRNENTEHAFTVHAKIEKQIEKLIAKEQEKG
jgi:hypothetical protein